MMMKHHARAMKTRLPMAHEIVVQDMMVNDFCVSAASLSQLLEACSQTGEMCASMGMRIHKFASNHCTLLEGLAKDEIAKTIEIGDPEDKLVAGIELPNIKTLGMLWLSKEDLFAFQWKTLHPDGGLSGQCAASPGDCLTLCGSFLQLPYLARCLFRSCGGGS